MRPIDADKFAVYSFKTPDGYDDDSYTAGVVRVLEDMDEVPTLCYKDLVPHGKWLAYPSDFYMKCSVCGMEYHKSRMPDVVGYCPNPNCGAKMDGKGDNK